jgi:hypothetical protein
MCQLSNLLRCGHQNATIERAFPEKRLQLVLKGSKSALALALFSRFDG